MSAKTALQDHESSPAYVKMPLRPTFTATIILPKDMTAKEAEKLCEAIRLCVIQPRGQAEKETT